MKPVRWLGTSLADLRAFPEGARTRAGHELLRVQLGADPTDWKPMSTVGPGVREIRVRVGTAHRVIYLATRDDAVYVLHAFEKKTRSTSRRDVDLASSRLRALFAEQRERDRS